MCVFFSDIQCSEGDFSCVHSTFMRSFRDKACEIIQVVYRFNLCASNGKILSFRDVDSVVLNFV